MSCWFTPARAAISAVRAPAKPFAPNSATAASRIFSLVRADVRRADCSGAARRGDGGVSAGGGSVGGGSVGSAGSAAVDTPPGYIIQLNE
ncbi:hypothetical protein GCM10009839_81930 [Catenulispora yoronensis]|uniref:Uncharacterized protein n=1 Tax=Catenulispora yoronensis TaxID=450799 RepID=A0ABP5GZK9_9ACTN